MATATTTFFDHYSFRFHSHLIRLLRRPQLPLPTTATTTTTSGNYRLNSAPQQ